MHLQTEDLPNLDDVILQNGNLCIYTMGERTNLAYQMQTGGYQFLVDAQNAEILEAVSDMGEDTVIYTDTNGQQEIEGSEAVQGYYTLQDRKRNIYIYDACGQTYYDVDSGKYHSEILQEIRSKDTVFGNEDDTTETSAQVYSDLHTIGSVYDYFFEKYKEDGWGILVGISNDQLGRYQGENAAAGIVSYEGLLPSGIPGYDSEKYQGKTGLMLLGTKYAGRGTQSMDVIGHEYTHMITQKYAKWSSGNVETGAIKEAISDIFGEIIKEDKGDGADWKMGDRILYDPSQNGYPMRTEEKEVLQGNRITVRNASGQEYQTDYAHGYSTVISYAAYLMKNGLNGDSALQLSWDELGKLWYRAVLMMPSDCNFSQCREIVEYAADSMEELTEEQRANIRRAFDIVEIFDAKEGAEQIDYQLKQGSTLRVYDKNQDYYAGYKVKITGISGEEKTLETGIASIRHPYNREFTVEEKGPYELNLPDGIYRFTITDPNQTETYSFGVQINDNGTDDSMIVSTQYESPMVVKITDTPIVYQKELYDEVLQEYQDAVNAYAIGGEEALKGKFLYISNFLVSEKVNRNVPINYGYYDIDGNGVEELLLGYPVIQDTEYKIVDVFSQDGERVQKVGDEDTFSEYTGSAIYQNGVIYSGTDGQENYYKINADGYDLDKIDPPADLGKEIVVEWKELEIKSLEAETEESIMSKEEVYQKLVEHYAKGTIDSPGEDLVVMEGSVNGTTYTTTVRCGMPGNPEASQALYEVSVDMETGIASQTRMLLPDGNVEQFNLRENE